MGKNIHITLFGESHGKGVGALITGLPPHIPVNEDAIEKALAARRPKDPYATARVEPDPWEILSGTYKGKTTGDPLAIWIPNKDTKSQDYDNLPFRPGHGAENGGFFQKSQKSGEKQTAKNKSPPWKKPKKKKTASAAS